MSSAQQVASGATYRFDRYELFPEAGQLRRNGMLVHLAPQPFRVLLLLVTRAGTIITREEIQEELWDEGTFVDYDQSINAVIRRIRSALNDHVERPRFLQTVPRRGYRFVATVERTDPLAWRASLESIRPAEPISADVFAHLVPDPPSPRRATLRSRLAFVLALLAPILLATHGPQPAPVKDGDAKVVRVAVMPVGTDGPQTEVDPRLVSAELRSRLGRIQPERIRVADAGTPADVRVDAVLRGVTDGVRIDVRLTEIGSGRQVWSDSFHRAGEAADFPLEVAVRVTRVVVERCVPAPRRDILVRAGVPQRALAAYSEARAIAASPGPQRDTDRALALLESAVRIEPQFGEAWSAIGDIWTERAIQEMGTTRSEAVVKARLSLDRAVAIAPHCAEALNDRGLLAMQIDRDYAEAERLMRAAIAGDPDYNHARFNLALLLSAMGKHEEAVTQMQSAQANDPAMFTADPTLGFLYLMARRYGDATAEYHIVRLNGQRPELAYWGLLSAAVGAHRWDDAARWLSALLQERVEIPADAANREAVFRKELGRFESRLLARERAKQLDPYVVACFYAQTDNPDLAFAALGRAADNQSFNAMFADVDPRLDSIRGDPRFGAYLERLSLRR